MLGDILAISDENAFPVLIDVGFVSFFFWYHDTNDASKYFNVADILFLSSSILFRY